MGINFTGAAKPVFSESSKLDNLYEGYCYGYIKEISEYIQNNRQMLKLTVAGISSGEESQYCEVTSDFMISNDLIEKSDDKAVIIHSGREFQLVGSALIIALHRLFISDNNLPESPSIRNIIKKSVQFRVVKERDNQYMELISDSNPKYLVKIYVDPEDITINKV